MEFFRLFWIILQLGTKTSSLPLVEYKIMAILYLHPISCYNYRSNIYHPYHPKWKTEGKFFTFFTEHNWGSTLISILSPSSRNSGYNVWFSDTATSWGWHDAGTHKAQFKFCRFSLQRSFFNYYKINKYINREKCSSKFGAKFS